MRVLTHLSLENFRLFKEKTSFDLAPITILTGTNSSGKSSLIKAILLLKSNFEKNKSIEEIDFSMGDHNLNDFKNSLNYDSESDMMYFTFSSYVNDLGMNQIELGYKLDRNNKSKGNLNSIIIYSPDGKVILSALKEFDDEIGPNITYNIDVKYFIKNLDHQVLNTNIKKEIYDDPYERWVQKYWLNSKQDLFNINPGSEEHKVYLNALDYLKSHGLRVQMGWTKDESQHFNQSIVDGLGNLGKELIEWLELNLNQKNINFERKDFGDFFYYDFSKWILKETVRYIFYNFDSISHFSSIRSITKKYYSVDDKDLLSLLINYKRFSPEFNSEISGFIKFQMDTFSIDGSIEIEIFRDIFAEIFVFKDGRKTLLSDLGFGYTQLLPIIMKIALIAHLVEKGEEFFLPQMAGDMRDLEYFESLFLLEEPESNLHPAFQSKIAEMIAYASSKFKIRFIVETHSEYLIRNLQFLIAKGKILNSNQVKIFYFNKPGSEEAEDSLFRTIQIDPKGKMTAGFGSGFFDEAESIAFDLFMLNQNRHN